MGCSKRKRPGLRAADLGFLVAPTGFEPATSALRGRRPKPLDDGATYVRRCVEMAGVGGVEPPHTAPETAVLPLDDKEMKIRRPQHQERKKGIKIGGHFDYTTTTTHWKCPNFARIQRPTWVWIQKR